MGFEFLPLCRADMTERGWQEVDFDNLGNEKMLIFDRLGIKCVYLQAKCKALPSNLFCEIKNCKKRCASFLFLRT